MKISDNPLFSVHSSSMSSTSSLNLQNPTFLKLKLHAPSSATTTTRRSNSTVRCGGPRSHRGPLLKGRILSIEAIQTIQTLKRLHRTNPPNLTTQISTTLTRLIKNDLLATLRELLRQQQCTLALQVFSAVRSEYGADLTLYAEMANTLASAGFSDDVDRLIVELEEGGGIVCGDGDQKGLVGLIKAVVGAGRRESTVKIYQMMKRSGWGTSVDPDEYVVKVLGNGFKGFGELELAREVQDLGKTALGRISRAKFDTLRI